MKRSLFILEFKRVIFPTLITFVAFAVAMPWVVGGIAHYLLREQIAQSKVNLEDLAGIANGTAFPLLILSALFTGRAVFSVEFKQKYFLFVRSIPIGKGALWGTLLLANLAAVLVSTVAVIALRLSSVMEMEKPVLLGGVVLYLVLFCAGACYTLLLRAAPMVLLAGLLGTIVSLIACVCLAVAFASHPGRHGYLPMPSGSPDPLYLAFCCLVMAAMYLVPGRRFFLRGEFNLIRVRQRNWLFLIATHVLCFFGLMLVQSLGLFTIGDRWIATSGGEISHDGKYVASVEWLARHPQFRRISIVEVRTGRLVGRASFRGLMDAGWTSDDKSLVVALADDAPLPRLGYLLPPSDSLVWISPEGRQTARVTFRFSSLSHVLFGDEGRTLAMMIQWGKGKVVSISDATRAVTELAACDSTSRGFLWAREGYFEKVRDLRIAVFGRPPDVLGGQPAGIRVIRGDAQVLSWNNTNRLRVRACLVNGVFCSSEEEAVAQIAKLYPFNPDTAISQIPGTVGIYAFPYGPVGYFDEGTALFYVRAHPVTDSSELWVFEQDKRRWVLLTRDFVSPFKTTPPLVDAQPSYQKELWRAWPPSMIQPQVGLATYAVKKGSAWEGYLYDARVGTPRLLASFEGQSLTSWLWPMEGAAWWVGFGGGITAADARLHILKSLAYRPGTGPLMELAEASWNLTRPLFADGQGNAVYLGQGPLNWIYVGADQKQIRLWPPAQK